jgi:choline dehydrogenase-like flavoprotein
MIVLMDYTQCSSDENHDSNNIATIKNDLIIDNVDKFSTIIVGGGTAGCTTAYILAKWMDDNNIPGNVLLIDRGVEFASNEGPNTKMGSWYDNWCEYGESHESINGIDGKAYPVTPSDHRGLGGCSTHDTRITFQITDDQKQRMAKEMGWPVIQLSSYYQAALNLMPLAPAIKIDQPVKFYDAVIDNLTNDSSKVKLNRLDNDEHKSEITVNSIAQSSLAMYSKDELRWAAAYLMHDDNKPKKLKIITDAVVDKILFSNDNDNNELKATGVNIMISGKPYIAKLDLNAKNSDIAITSGAIGNAAVLQRSGVGPNDLLTSLRIPVVIDNPYVGHGIDHEEIAILYEWLEKWNENDGTLPKGGVMGWPLVLFASFRPETDEIYGKEYTKRLSKYFEAHFGAGYAEPYTSFPSVVVTPSCIRPNHSSINNGFRVMIKSKDPMSSCLVVQGDHRNDLETMAQGVFAVTDILKELVNKNIIGKQLEPPFEVNIENRNQLIDWIKMNHFTVYHWACTCQSGIHGRVADEHFRIRVNNDNVVSNLRVGSAASLPELCEANPHLTVTAFAIALADEIARNKALSYGMKYIEPIEIMKANKDVISNNGKTIIRRESEEVPSLSTHALKHYQKYHIDKLE